MAKASARILPSIEEKRYVTLQFLEGAFISGTRVRITPVKTYTISDLSKETYTYDTPVDCYIIYNERPKVSLLKQHGWYRDNQEGPLPQIAQIATHLLYTKGDVSIPVHDVQLLGNNMRALVKTGQSDNYILKPLVIKRGTLIDVFYDFAPPKALTTEEEVSQFESTHSTVLDLEVETVTVEDKYIVTVALQAFDLLSSAAKTELAPEKLLLDNLLEEIESLEDPENPIEIVIPEDRYPIDSNQVINRFIVVEPFIDTISINYTCNIMPYRYDKTSEVPTEEEARPNTNDWLNFDATKHDT